MNKWRDGWRDGVTDESSYSSLLIGIQIPSLWRNRLEADCGSEGMGFDPHSGNSKVRLFSLSILTAKIDSGGSELYSSINLFGGVSIM
jgi:hypothetical protein